MFGRRKPKSPAETAPPAVDLDVLITSFGEQLDFWESQGESAVLLRARIADACRDAGIHPVSEARFLNTWNRLGVDHRQRFGLLSAALDLPEVASRTIQIGAVADPGEAVLGLLERLTDRLRFLTIAVLRDSDLRLEEFARHFCATWGLSIEGETTAASTARLHDIDFDRLMREADAARASAGDRLAYLRNLQEEQEKTRRPRRGKW